MASASVSPNSPDDRLPDRQRRLLPTPMLNGIEQVTPAEEEVIGEGSVNHSAFSALQDQFATRDVCALFDGNALCRVVRNSRQSCTQEADTRNSQFSLTHF
jgi:hypothetical protein